MSTIVPLKQLISMVAGLLNRLSSQGWERQGLDIRMT